jgi:DNA-binding NtrC family response regulator
MEGTILIADSDTVFMNSIARYFSGRQFAVTAFEDFDVAIESLLRTSYDIAIVEFCKHHVREKLCTGLPCRAPGTALILTCGMYTHDLEIQARSIAPAFFFVKPFELSDLYAVVVRLVETKDRQAILSQQRALHRDGVHHE